MNEWMSVHLDSGLEIPWVAHDSATKNSRADRSRNTSSEQKGAKMLCSPREKMKTNKILSYCSISSATQVSFWTLLLLKYLMCLRLSFKSLFEQNSIQLKQCQSGQDPGKRQIQKLQKQWKSIIWLAVAWVSFACLCLSLGFDSITSRLRHLQS